jgi:hypothetical protein
MKRKIFITLIFLVLFTQSAHCLDTRLYGIRQKLFTQAEDIKKLVNRDNAGRYLVLVSSMWDTCFVAITQLDAYFYILGLFNTIRKEHITHPAVGFLSRWLKQIKETSELNIKGLDGIKVPIEPMIRINMVKLKRYFRELNNLINKELADIAKLKKSLDKALEPALGAP